VLIAYSDIGGPPTTLQNQILAEGVIAADLFDAFSGTPTLAQLEQARPYRPDGPPGNAEAHTQRTLECLEAARAIGCTTQELRAKGCGERPPNRVCDLRKRGIAIKTKREPHGVTRYILAKYLPASGDWYTRQTGKPRPGWQARPFSEKRIAQDDCFRLTPPTFEKARP
jgi:hypothetical protein